MPQVSASDVSDYCFSSSPCWITMPALASKWTPFNGSSSSCHFRPREDSHQIAPQGCGLPHKVFLTALVRGVSSGSIQGPYLESQEVRVMALKLWPASKSPGKLVKVEFWAPPLMMYSFSRSGVGSENFHF